MCSVFFLCCMTFRNEYDVAMVWIRSIKSHKALLLRVSFVILPVYHNGVDGTFLEYLGFVRQRICEAEIMQLMFLLKRNCFKKGIILLRRYFTQKNYK